MARIIVTGGAGFIGSHLVDAFLGRQQHEVLVLDDLSTGQEANLQSARAAAGDRLQTLWVDIVSEEAAKAVEQFKPDIIVHLAAQMNVRRSVAEPVFDARTNVLGTVNLLEAARRAGIKRFVFSSTGGAVYGEQEEFPAKESHRLMPESAYGVSKAASELYIQYFGRIYGFEGVALRFGNVYGPRQNPKGEAGVVAIFAERYLRDETLLVNGDGNQTRDYIYVSDVVQACVLASERDLPAPYAVFNVGLGRESTVLDLVNAIKQISPTQRVKVEHGPALPGEQRRSVIDSSRIRKELGWDPKMELAQGLRQTVQSFSKN